MEEILEGIPVNGVIFITGAESTGKSTLTEALAQRFGAPGIPEFARGYLECLGRPYLRADVELIARNQMRLIRENRGPGLVFFDTCLFNLKVWFREVYGDVPEWLLSAIPDLGRGEYLLCEPDIPWQPDPLRENPGRRDYLSSQYRDEILKAGFRIWPVTGTGDDRVNSAVSVMEGIFKGNI